MKLSQCRAAVLIPVAVATAITAAVTLGSDAAGAALAPVSLGTASSFAVLASSEITNTGPSVVNGNLAVSTGTSVSGFPLGLVNGTTHTGTDGVGARAKADSATAYAIAAGASPVQNVATELGGTSPAGGVYASDTLGLTGTLTLNGSADTVWIFKAASTLISASDSAIVFTGGANACNVFWQIGSSATLGTRSAFAGTVLAQDSISAGNGASVRGRLFAQTGAVTLINNVITAPDCAVTPGEGSGGSTGSTGSSGSSGSSGSGSGSGGPTDDRTPAMSSGDPTASGATGLNATDEVTVDAAGRGSATSPETAAATTTTELAITGDDQLHTVVGGVLAVVLGGLTLLLARRRPAVARHRR